MVLTHKTQLEPSTLLNHCLHHPANSQKPKKLLDLVGNTNAPISALTTKHNTSIKQIKALAGFHNIVKKSRAPNIFNVLVHAKALEINPVTISNTINTSQTHLQRAYQKPFTYQKPSVTRLAHSKRNKTIIFYTVIPTLSSKGTQGRKPTTRAQTRAEPTQTATPPVSSRQDRTTAPPPFPQPDSTRLHTREQADTFIEARTHWLQYYTRSHPQLIPRTQHDPPVSEEDIYNEQDFEEFATEGQPVPHPTPQILPPAPNPSPIPPTSTMSNTTAPKPTKFGQIDNFDGMPDRANGWMLSAKAYFDVNDTIYNSNKKKAFKALSHMKEGATLVWKETKLTEYTGSGKYPKWADFKTDFNGTFITADVKGAASAALMTMKMETGETAVKFNSHFMVDAGKSGLNDEGLIMVYKSSIRPYLLQNMPTGQTRTASAKENGEGKEKRRKRRKEEEANHPRQNIYPKMKKTRSKEKGDTLYAKNRDTSHGSVRKRRKENNRIKGSERQKLKRMKPKRW
ncbi:hypothetical protein SERLADRAFT_431869 [Serpula lacrymans var. lacrymans S7.9]|uniref:Retrotransposon gag domain-containing protein n=1 Tax=Serpula lacrymans var. lacrymans (strain S7.9) TaxID=578457 RepID=F8NDQ6_SERL9|nr:uncharacterized protein SERLADRAFT_431869 [Serpula lacrymans var. lacrymans S7.9]EGO30340.1 hypothetical protein SERLADRAFT_431869 [Serpula lacrymans var. lacrymans S7.9]